jgi:uncharacterized protein YndB with AHSA1/START domain
MLTATSLTILTDKFALTFLIMKSINNNAPVKCSKTVTVNASIEKVWAILTDIDNWKSWQTDISKSTLNGDLKPETTFDWKSAEQLFIQH